VKVDIGGLNLLALAIKPLLDLEIGVVVGRWLGLRLCKCECRGEE
jgi:hypothetical protein